MARGLTGAERNRRFALLLYTIENGLVYRTFNQTLRERSKRTAQFDAFQPFLWHLCDALRALPDERQTVYRGISDLPRLESYTQV